MAPPVSRAADSQTGSRAFIVADDKSGHILLQSHATDKLQVASLTKIASAVVVLDWARLDNHPLDTPVSIPASIIAAYQDNPIGFQEGDEISLRDLLYASMMQSDAIATDTLAAFVGRELPVVQGEDKVARRQHGAFRRADERPRAQTQDGAHPFSQSDRDSTARSARTRRRRTSRGCRATRWPRRTSGFLSRRRNGASP